jgi:hypothetical protein
MSRNAIPEPVEANFEMPEITHSIENQRTISLGYRLLAGLVGTMGVAQSALLFTPSYVPQAVGYGILGVVGLTTAITGKNLAIELRNGISHLLNRGRDREVEYRGVAREADHENRSLDDLLAEANQVSVADNARGAVNANFIRDAIESNFSPYRLAAQQFIEFLPNDVTKNQLTSLANRYYKNGQRDQNAQLIIAEDQREAFNQGLVEFRNNYITTPTSIQNSFGRINDARISQAIFFSSIVALMKNKDDLLSEEAEEGQLIEKIKAISENNPNLVSSIEEALNSHLLNIYNDMAREGSQDGKIAVLYGYKFAKEGNTQAIGGAVSSANSSTQTASQDSGPNTDSTTILSTAEVVVSVSNPAATQLSQSPNHQRDESLNR